MEVIMSDLKNGDIVELTSGLANNLYHGDRLKFITSDGDSALLSQTIIVSKHIFKKVEEFKPDYEQSNRYKLSQFIKAQPYKAIELSVAIGHQATYLSSTASKSRFESRGDISDTKLSEIIESIREHNKGKLKTTLDAINDTKAMLDCLHRNEKPLPDFKFEIPKNSFEKSESEFKKLADGCRNMGNEANQAGLSISKFNQQVKTKSIQVSKKAVWFTIFLITVLIVSLLATLIYLA